MFRPGALDRLEERVLVDLLQACADDPFGVVCGPVEAWWGGLKDARRARLLGESLRFELVVRRRCTLGLPVWAELSLRAPRDLAGLERLWLVTGTARLRVDGREPESKPWPGGRPLAAPWRNNLDLATLVGDRFDATGRHTVAVAFEAVILRVRPGLDVAQGTSLWSGTLPAGEVAFDMVRIPPDDLLEAMPATGADVGGALSIVMVAQGARVDLWPPSREVKTLVVPARTPKATVRIGATRWIGVGLGFDVVAGPVDGGNPCRLGRLSAAGFSPAGAPVEAGVLDLSAPLADRGGVALRLELVPSVTAAYRSPRIVRYWDRRLDLGTVRFLLEP